jgi:hypothetical protein
VKARFLRGNTMADYEIEQDVTKKLDSLRKDSHIKSENGKDFFILCVVDEFGLLADL